MNKKLILILPFLFQAFCQTMPERIDKEEISNPTLQAELKPIEREIVDINHSIKKQEERENEFIQLKEEAREKYQEAEKDKKDSLKPMVERASLKAKIETTRREMLQLKLKEKIAFYELKKASMVSSQADKTIEIKPYEEFHKSSLSNLKSKEEDLQKLEKELEDFDKENQNPESL